MNRVYSILVKGVDKDSESYQRKVDPTVGYSGLESVGDLLVADATDGSYYNYQAEQLVQICRKSALKGSLEAFDPVNTYEHVFGAITPITERGSLPYGVSMDILEPSMGHSWATRVFAITINPSTRIALINGVPTTFTTSDNMTSTINLDQGLGVRFRGAIPGTTFSTSLKVSRQPVRDVGSLVTALRELNTRWYAPYSKYRTTLDINDWLAAFILNYCEATDGNNS